MAGLLLLVGLLTACAADDEAPAPVTMRSDPVAAAAVLDDLTNAVEAVEAGGDAPNEGTRWPAYVVANAQALGIVDFSARYVDDDPAAATHLVEDQWAAAVDVAWRFDGRDPQAAHAEVTFVFDGRGNDLRLVSVGGGGRVMPLWLSGTVTAVSSPEALVMIAGEHRVRAREYAGMARRAVRAVGKALPRLTGKNGQGLVVEVPSGSSELERVLNVERDTYENIAAVTTMVDGTTAPGSPVHVFVNDLLFSDLSRRGAQVVMTHEATHVVTEAAATLSVPLWLVEGFADHVALLDSDLPLSVSAAQVIAQVHEDGVPKTLPDDSAFDSRTTHLGAAYEAAWLVCRVLAEHGSIDAMVDLQQRLAGGQDLNKALQATHGLTTRELVKLWRTELERLSQ